MEEIKIMASKLSVSYGEKLAIEDISMQFRCNEVAALIGPSGCGKSTFLRSLNRMNDFVQGVKINGQVIFNGEDIYHPSVDPVGVRRRIGMVFQKPNPFPKTIFENIAWAPRIAGMSKSMIPGLVEQSLKQAALWDEVKERLHQSALSLSGGQQQRLCIARALAMKPSVLLMDEPCSALDPIATGKIEDLISELKASYTIVIVTHNMQQAARVSDNTAFFLSGKLIESGQTKQIFTLPRDPQTENYISGKFG